MNTTTDTVDSLVKPHKFTPQPYEYKITALRECATAETSMMDTPERVNNYWHENVATDPRYNPEVECLVVLMLNTRTRIKGHYLVSIGTIDTLLVHPREVFRLAIAASATAIVMVHNHPSGNPQPSEADIKVTRDLIRAGQIIKIELLDHVIIGRIGVKPYASLKEFGYFH